MIMMYPNSYAITTELGKVARHALNCCELSMDELTPPWGLHKLSGVANWLLQLSFFPELAEADFSRFCLVSKKTREEYISYCRQNNFPLLYPPAIQDVMKAPALWPGRAYLKFPIATPGVEVYKKITPGVPGDGDLVVASCLGSQVREGGDPALALKDAISMVQRMFKVASYTEFATLEEVCAFVGWSFLDVPATITLLGGCHWILDSDGIIIGIVDDAEYEEDIFAFSNLYCTTNQEDAERLKVKAEERGLPTFQVTESLVYQPGFDLS